MAVNPRIQIPSQDSSGSLIYAFKRDRQCVPRQWVQRCAAGKSLTQSIESIEQRSPLNSCQWHTTTPTTCGVYFRSRTMLFSPDVMSAVNPLLLAFKYFKGIGGSFLPNS